MDDELARIVGERLKRLRIQSGVGLREQARTIGISASSLSGLENSRGGMSLSRLQLVAAHFGLHISDLLGGDGSADAETGQVVEVIRRDDRAHLSVRRGNGTIYTMLGSGRDHALQPATITFEPGGGYERDRMGHVGEEFAYVIFGDIELLHGDDTYRLGAGDSVRFSAPAPHAYRNASDTEMAFLVVAATPPW